MDSANSDCCINNEGNDSSSTGVPAGLPSSPPFTTSNRKDEVVLCILKGLMLADEMKSSVKNMEGLLKYAKDLYCKGDHNLEKYWPSNWRETEKILRDAGYEDPKKYFTCLDKSHYANYDILESKEVLCRLCKKPGKYSTTNILFSIKTSNCGALMIQCVKR